MYSISRVSYFRKCTVQKGLYPIAAYFYWICVWPLFFFHSPAASSLYLFVCCMSRWDFSVRQITCGKVLRPIFFAVLTAFYMFYIVNCVCVSLSLFSTVVLYSTFNLSTSPREKQRCRLPFTNPPSTEWKHRYALARSILSFVHPLFAHSISFTFVCAAMFYVIPSILRKKSIFSLQSSVVQKILQLRTYFLPPYAYFIPCSSFSSDFTSICVCV